MDQNLFVGIIWFILGGIGAIFLPEPFNYFAAATGLCAFFYEMWKEEPTESPPPVIKQWSYIPPAKEPPPYIEHRRHYASEKHLLSRRMHYERRVANELEIEPLGSGEENKVIKPEQQGQHKKCMRCGTWSSNGLSLARGSDDFWFCFGCDRAVFDKEQLIRVARSKLAAEPQDGLFEIDLQERHAFLLDAIVDHFVYDNKTVGADLELSKYCPGYFVIGSDILDLKRKIHIWAEALRSARRVEDTSKPKSESVEDVHDWMGM